MKGWRWRSDTAKEVPLAGKVIWTEGHQWIRISKGDLVITVNGSGPGMAMIKEANYGAYTRVCPWPFLGYGRWAGRGRIKQVVEPTIWSRLIRFVTQ